MLYLADNVLDDIINGAEGSKTTPTQFGPFVGKGSQKAAAEAAKAEGVSSPLIVHVDRREFFAFANPAARAVFLDSVNANRSRELIERVDGSRPFRPVIDVDGPETLAEADVDDLRDAFTAVALDWGVPEEMAVPLAVRGRRTGKTSVHFVADGWQVADGPAGRKFAEAVRQQVPEALRDYIDVKASGCSANATLGLRLPWVPKLDAPGGKPIPGSVLEPEEFGDWGARVAPWCLQDAERCGPVYGPGARPREADGGPRAQVTNLIETPRDTRHLCSPVLGARSGGKHGPWPAVQRPSPSSGEPVWVPAP